MGLEPATRATATSLPLPRTFGLSIPKPYQGADMCKLLVFRGENVQDARGESQNVQDAQIKLAQEFAQCTTERRALALAPPFATARNISGRHGITAVP